MDTSEDASSCTNETSVTLYDADISGKPNDSNPIILRSWIVLGIVRIKHLALLTENILPTSFKYEVIIVHSYNFVFLYYK